MQDTPRGEQCCKRTIECRLKSTNALRTAEHQEELIALGKPTCCSRGGAGDRQFAHRGASHRCLIAVPWRALRGLPPGNGAMRSERRNKGVRSARLHVPLPKEARRARQPRGDQCGNGDVAASRKDHIGPNATNQTNRLRDRPEQLGGITRSCEQPCTTRSQARGGQERQRVSRLWNKARLDATCAAEPADLSVGMELANRTSYGERWEEMSPRSATRD